MKAALERQRAFFNSGKTRDLSFRRDQLIKLRAAIKANEEAILAALAKDLSKPSLEAYLSEIAFLYEEISFTLKHLKSWAKPRKVATPLIQMPASSQILPEPLGVVLVIGPWNYPFQLLLAPAVGAIAAGNCVVLKPSELSPHTSKVIAATLRDFDPAFLRVEEGGVEVSQALLAERYDHIFFTGGTGVGKVVMSAAAKYLTPVTLELGGKSPCIIDKDTDLDATARRVTWGKFFNAGQTCVAPDYLLVPRKMRADLVGRMRGYVEKFFGPDPEKSPDYARIVNPRHFQRLSSLLDPAATGFGGTASEKSLYIAPTALVGISADHKAMGDEIFGPILPVIDYDELEEAVRFVKDRPKPLALYFFSNDRARQEKILSETSFGGGCINDTLVHLGNPRLPFGGVGESGMGAYHGKYTFDTFSHMKSVVRRSFWIDPSLRYPPYANKLGVLKRLIK